MGDNFIIFNNHSDEEYPEFVIKTDDKKETLEKISKGIEVLLSVANYKF